MTCQTCAQIVDVVTARYAWAPPTSNTAGDGTCRECGSNDLIPWGLRHEGHDEATVLRSDDCGPCPKCGSPMRATGLMSLWD